MFEDKHLSVEGHRASLATDFYQLTMMYAYFAAEMQGEATFEYFVRKLPRNRRFLVSAGLEQVLAYLRDLKFTSEEVDFLRQTPTFANAGDVRTRERFFEWLRAFDFGGTVRAVPEGTIFFPNEPVMQVTGDLLECQLIETYLLSTLNFQTLVASKAARLRLVAPGKGLVDFGTRRAHGPSAGALAARAAFVGGFDGTSNVHAAHVLGIPVVGTAAHAYTMAFKSEEAAFAHYLETFPHSTTLLIDTYDTARGAHRAAALGTDVGGVRLDSGDLGALAKEVRGILDAAGCPDTKIVASNDLNEYKIRDLLADSAPIDSFGVGTELVTSRDDPTLSGVYKLVEKIVGGEAVPTMKFSSSKPSYPGRKDFYRLTDSGGAPLGGALVQAGESPPGLQGASSSVQMLETVFEAGKPTRPPEKLETLRQRTIDGLKKLPAELREIEGKLPEHPTKLLVSEKTHALMDVCRDRFRE